MATKVDILDFAYVREVRCTAEMNGLMSISMELICENEEDYSLVYQTILEKVNGMRDKE